MSYKIPDSMKRAFKNNPITYVVPEPKIETEPQPDGSIKLVSGWDTKDFAGVISAIVQQMNEVFDDAIIKEFAASNGYVKKRTCRIVWNETDKTWECDSCGGAVGLKEVYFCESCGAEVVE